MLSDWRGLMWSDSAGSPSVCVEARTSKSNVARLLAAPRKNRSWRIFFFFFPTEAEDELKPKKTAHKSFPKGMTQEAGTTRANEMTARSKREMNRRTKWSRAEKSLVQNWTVFFFVARKKIAKEYSHSKSGKKRRGMFEHLISNVSVNAASLGFHLVFFLRGLVSKRKLKDRTEDLEILS